MSYPGGAPVTIVGVNTTGSNAGTIATTQPGTAAFDTSQAATSVSPAAAVQLVGARAGRRSVTITNITGTQPVYLTPNNRTTGVTTGGYIASTAGSSKTLPTAAAVFGTSPSAAQTVSIEETF